MVPTVASDSTAPVERRTSDRSRTEFGVALREGLSTEQVRCIDVSRDGLLVARARDDAETLTTDTDAVLTRLELRLPERRRPLRAWARPVWSRGPLTAYRIVRMNDVDRLTFAEHRDLANRRELRV
jgi:hypothetical protein